MRLYIAGPMSGIPQSNYPAFFAAARRLEAAGFTPINPARAEGQEHCHTWLDYMRRGLCDLAESDGVATLHGWSSSRGAALEVHIARALGLPRKAVDAWVDASACTRPRSAGADLHR